MVKNLKAKRMEHGLSQQQLGEKLGLSQQSINKYENHSIEPDISTLSKMADLFNTSIDYLVGHSNVDHVIEDVTLFHLNSEELRLIENYRSLYGDEKEIVKLLIDNYHNHRNRR